MKLEKYQPKDEREHAFILDALTAAEKEQYKILSILFVDRKADHGCNWMQIYAVMATPHGYFVAGTAQPKENKTIWALFGHTDMTRKETPRNDDAPIFGYSYASAQSIYRQQRKHGHRPQYCGFQL